MGEDCIVVNVPDEFRGRGRGPELMSWIHSHELLFHDSHHGFSMDNGAIVGARTENSWVVFHGLQVIQVVLEEVHSYWHIGNNNCEPSDSCIFLISNSEWLASFNPRHLQGHSHFVIHFYDDVVELICKELLFSSGTFSLELAIGNFPQLAYAYLRRAMSNEKIGRNADAILDYKRYIAIATDRDAIAYASRCLAYLES